MPYIRVDLTGYQREPGFSHFEIWRHTVDIPQPNSPPARVTRSATRVGERVINTRWEDTSAEAGVAYWYWARAIDRYGNASPFFCVGTIIAPPANIRLNSDRLLGRDSEGRGEAEEIELVAPLRFTGARALEVAEQGVTFAAHVQHIATARMLGRSTAGSGAVEELDGAAARGVMGLSTVATVQFGQVGIGTATPTGQIHIRSGGALADPVFAAVAVGMIISRSGGSGLTLHTSDAGTNYVIFADTTQGGHNSIAYQHATDTMVFSAGAAERLRLSAAGSTHAGPVTAPGYKVSTDQVVGARVTGWGAPTGTATRAAFDTASATLPEIAERLKALIDDLRTHGLIGN